MKTNTTTPSAPKTAKRPPYVVLGTSRSDRLQVKPSTGPDHETVAESFEDWTLRRSAEAAKYARLILAIVEPDQDHAPRKPRARDLLALRRCAELAAQALEALANGDHATAQVLSRDLLQRALEVANALNEQAIPSALEA